MQKSIISHCLTMMYYKWIVFNIMQLKNITLSSLARLYFLVMVCVMHTDNEIIL